jgi:hypothetical protein
MAGLSFAKMDVLRRYVFKLSEHLPDISDTEFWKEISPFIFYRWLSMEDRQTAGIMAGHQSQLESLTPIEATRYLRVILPRKKFLGNTQYLTKTKKKKL